MYFVNEAVFRILSMWKRGDYSQAFRATDTTLA